MPTDHGGCGEFGVSYEGADPQDSPTIASPGPEFGPKPKASFVSAIGPPWRSAPPPPTAPALAPVLAQCRRRSRWASPHGLGCARC